MKMCILMSRHPKEERVALSPYKLWCREVILNKIKYEEDSEPGGPSNFYRSGTNWACSSTARGSPLSLTYYAFCLGTRVLKNFNIENAAGGVRKEIIKNFTAVVTSGTLEIRFYWAGKGTTSLPYQGVYGPLISAISVNSDTVPPSDGKLSMGVLAGIVAAVVSPNHSASGYPLVGLLSDGTLIAVKQLSSKSKQGNREFVNEIGMISALQHPHLVKLYGCCIDGNQLLLVYEYMENNSLSRALFADNMSILSLKGPEECQLNLDWSTRYKICIGIARGLSYLHEESRLKIVHRDIKASNVLLDNGYMAPEYAMHGYLTYKADVYSFGIVALEIVSGRYNASDRTKENSFYILDWAIFIMYNQLEDMAFTIEYRLWNQTAPAASWFDRLVWSGVDNNVLKLGSMKFYQTSWCV
ncbi:unnamed protein product [Thlaspi arvense]|uniref:non-specific serine/threonine protein kinase n=1 Tax=Thlaspi arvense TaxID=13288 RepID=A0AAU9RJJ1_THLAR|nr:unnamed protein product [Thlaspi arvense]